MNRQKNSAWRGPPVFWSVRQDGNPVRRSPAPDFGAGASGRVALGFKIFMLQYDSGGEYAPRERSRTTESVVWEENRLTCRSPERDRRESGETVSSAGNETGARRFRTRPGRNKIVVRTTSPRPYPSSPSRRSACKSRSATARSFPKRRTALWPRRGTT